MNTLLSALIDGILTGGVYALIVLGVVLVAKATRIVNLAYGGTLLVLSYFTWWIVQSKGVPWPVGLLLMMVFAATLGWAINRFLMRPLIGRPEAELVTFIGTVILGSFVLYGLAILLWGGQPQVMPKIIPTGVIRIGSIVVSETRLVAFAVGILMFLAFVLYFRFSRNGLAMRSVAEDHQVSQSMGINVKRIFSYVWIVGVASSGLGGFLLASMNGLEAQTGNIAMTRALPVLLLAGLNSFPGALAGAMLVGMAESLGAAYVDPHLTAFSQVLPFVLMLVVLLILPNGLFGQKSLRRL